MHGTFLELKTRDVGHVRQNALDLALAQFRRRREARTNGRHDEILESFRPAVPPPPWSRRSPFASARTGLPTRAPPFRSGRRQGWRARVWNPPTPIRDPSDGPSEPSPCCLRGPRRRYRLASPPLTGS